MNPPGGPPKPKPRIALVYPPFGPPNLPSLGLALLSASAKQRGFDCRTFFWHYRFTAGLPLPQLTMPQKLKVYELFTQRDLFPWNEWMFQRYMFPEHLRHLDTAAMQRILDLDPNFSSTAGALTGGLPLSRLILHLCNNAGQIIASFANELAGFDIIGIASTFYQNGAALALAKYIKSQWPEKVTILGGANTDGEMGRALMELYPSLDYVFTGEADETFPEFLECLHEGRPMDHLRGLIRRDSSGRVVEGPTATPISDMNSLPIPDFDDYVAERKRFGLHDAQTGLCLPLESSRGCWWGAKSHCTFCGLNANGMSYRQKDYSRFQEEVKATVERYGARYLFMADNILSVRYYREFIAWARENNLGVDFFYEIKANMNRQQVRDLAESGISMVQPGIESFSSSVLMFQRIDQFGVILVEISSVA
jgi:ribosomal peptide maturation radical SAM protein 1